MSGFLKKYTFRFVLLLLFSVAGTVFTVIGPSVLGKITTVIFEGIMAKLDGTGKMDFERIARILSVLLILYVLGAVFHLLQGRMAETISERLTRDIRNAVTAKLFTIKMNCCDRYEKGDLQARLTTDVDGFGRNIGPCITQTVMAVTTLSGIALMMFLISVPMAFAGLFILPLSFLSLHILSKKTEHSFNKQAELETDLQSKAEEWYSGQNVIRLYGQEKEVCRQFAATGSELSRISQQAMFQSDLMVLVLQFLGNAGYVVSVLLGGWFAMAGQIGIGDIQAFIHYIRSFAHPVQQISGSRGMFQSVMASWKRIEQFLSEPEEAEIRVAGGAEDGNLQKGEVRFEHVSFGYVQEQIVIHDFSALVKPGQKAAIVGKTGTGKTTLAKLLVRFYDVDDGAVFVDGKDVRSFPLKELRSRFGMVFQDGWIFEDTVMENIRYGKPEASEEEIRRAAEAVGADDFIRNLPNGYETVIGENSSVLSGGQLQLITIARAMLSDPEILILDEATASVDTGTEQHVWRAMEQLMAGRTSFVIAHRLSTIRDADIIFVVEDGTITEQGTHGELMKRNGHYASLYNESFL